MRCPAGERAHAAWISIITSSCRKHRRRGRQHQVLASAPLRALRPCDRSSMRHWICRTNCSCAGLHASVGAGAARRWPACRRRALCLDRRRWISRPSAAAPTMRPAVTAGTGRCRRAAPWPGSCRWSRPGAADGDRSCHYLKHRRAQVRAELASTAGGSTWRYATAAEFTFPSRSVLPRRRPLTAAALGRDIRTAPAAAHRLNAAEACDLTAPCPPAARPAGARAVPKACFSIRTNCCVLGPTGWWTC